VALDFVQTVAFAGLVLFGGYWLKRRIPLLASYNSLQTFSWNTLAAATVLSLVPPVLIAIIFQRYVVSGLSHGALK